MRINPFTYGNPISAPMRFFGRKREVEQVFSRLRNAEFESSSLVGERRVGKTSLLNYLMHPDVRLSYGLDLDKYIFVYVDLGTICSRPWRRSPGHEGGTGYAGEHHRLSGATAR